jgi:hypothetical protein
VEVSHAGRMDVNEDSQLDGRALIFKLIEKTRKEGP